MDQLDVLTKSRDGRSPGVSGDLSGSADSSVESGKSGAERLEILVVATFTADLIVRPLEFWAQRIAVDAEISVGPYAQVMQELLNPSSDLSKNQSGVNILLVRLADLSGDSLDDPGEVSRRLSRSATEFEAAVRAFRVRVNGHLFVYFCPPGSALSESHRAAIDLGNLRLIESLSALKSTHCWTHSDLNKLYPLEEYEDSAAEKIGAIPYTNEYFAALATLFMRRIAAITKPPYKVIAVDCDNTLWKGVVGEDGPSGVEITPEHMRFQRTLVGQSEAGVLICLCSKNVLSDVEAVFRERPDMPLRPEHIVAWQVNWQTKSSNLNELADDLGLGLDSFALIDDSEAECAEVRASCPSVLTLLFPQSSREIEHFLAHVWAFDRVDVTEEAKKRASLYKTEHFRKAALKRSSGFDDFIASLQLQVTCAAMRPEQLPRVSELIQRTNQFNLTVVRRRAADIESRLNSGELSCWVVTVCDRFGDYGLTGGLLLEPRGEWMYVDSFVLSCRVLGRGVEHRVARELGAIARRLGYSQVIMGYREMPRNEPARAFLEETFGRFRITGGFASQFPLDACFAVPVEVMEAASYRGSGEAVVSPSEAPKRRVPERARSAPKWVEAAYELTHLTDLVEAIFPSTATARTTTVEYVAPRTNAEAAVAQLWEKVLGVQEVGVRDDFFEIGGDSLSAVQVLSRMSAVFGREVSLGELFEQPTVEEIAALVSSGSETEAELRDDNHDGTAPLSYGQQRLWFIDQLERGSTAYHVPYCLEITGQLHIEVLRGALDALLARHESLRTTFRQVGGNPVQIIHKETSLNLKFVDLSNKPQPEREHERLQHIRDETTRLFLLDQGPLFRGLLLRLEPSRHELLLVMHHIITDGWSMGVIFSDLAGIYRERLSGAGASPHPLKVQYADFAQWQRQSLPAARSKHLEFWEQKLLGAPEILDLPTDRPRPSAQSYRGSSIKISLGSQLTEDLKGRSRTLRSTVAMALLSAWTVVLSSLSGQEDLVIGMPVANRRRAEFDDVVGFFVNTLPLRMKISRTQPLNEVLTLVKRNVLDAYAHEEMPLEQIVEALHPVRHLSHSALFQVLFVYQGAPRRPMEFPGLEVSEQEMAPDGAQFDLLLSLRERDDEIVGYLNFATDLFDQATIERWAGYLLRVVEAIVKCPERSIEQLDLLSDSEYHRVVRQFNLTTSPRPTERFVHEMFEDQAKESPDRTAVTADTRSLTYHHLSTMSDKLASYLKFLGVGPDRPVAVCLERGSEMVLALIAILKAGGVYLPLDPRYPADRLNHMLEDAKPQLVLAQRETEKSVSDAYTKVVLLDDLLRNPLQTGGPLPTHGSSDALVYVIYTSGSTGKPKATAMPHRCVVNLLEWHRQWLPTDGGGRVLQFAALSFDVAFQEIFSTLCTGGTLILLDEWTRRDSLALARYLNRHAIQTLFIPPLMLQSLAECDEVTQLPLGELRNVVTAGEQLKISPEIRELFKLNAGSRLHNHYGPTESHVVTALMLSGNPDGWPSVPSIGRPIPNSAIYVLDVCLRPVPLGVKGEIYIGGVTLGRGYLNRPDLTAERFVSNPFNEGSRLYKTGDLGRWKSDGSLEYLGRNDHQIKIRGFRVELGEIEAQLAQYDEVKEAVVQLRDSARGDKSLVAYVTLRTLGDSALESIRTRLKSALPDYMVPRAFVVLPHLPRTPIGKVDRSALPLPDADAYQVQRYESPIGPAEEALAGIWSSVLKVERVGRHDNFFELGGHSLLIVEMLASLRKAGLFADVRHVFESASLMELAASLTTEPRSEPVVAPNLIPLGCEAITPEMVTLVKLEPIHIAHIATLVPGGVCNIQDIYPLTPLQEGILFHHLLQEQEGDTYARPLLLSLSSREHVESLKGALQALIDRHDALRTAFIWERLPEPVQVVYRRATLWAQEKGLDGDVDPVSQLEHKMEPAYQRMDLHEAPLLRLEIYHDEAASRWLALLQTHHLILDNESLETLLSETMAHIRGQTEVWPEVRPYREHVAQVVRRSRVGDAERYFREKLGDVSEPTAPFGVLDVHKDGRGNLRSTRELPIDLAIALRTQAKRYGLTPATLFHTVWALVVAQTSGRTDVVFGSVLLGRLQGSTDERPTLGMCINTLPLRIRLSDETAASLVSRVQLELAGLLDYEQSSLAVAQRCSAIPASTPLFSALLNYRHGLDATRTEWDGRHGVSLLSAQGWTNYPLVLSVDEHEQGFKLEFQTDSRLDPTRFADYVISSTRALVKGLLESPEVRAVDLFVLPEREEDLLVRGLNSTRAQYSNPRLAHELVAEQAIQRPDAMAVICGQQQLTYAELDSRANRLARHLGIVGIRTGQLVGLCLERGVDLVIGLLATLKSGAAYLPLDPNYPNERLAYMLEESCPGVLLTRRALVDKLPGSSVRVLLLDDLDAISTGGPQKAHDRDQIEVSSRSLAYVIYTSGSTGKPKGVMVEHRSLANLIHWHRTAFDLNPGDRSSSVAAVGFDASGWEIWPALAVGASLVLALPGTTSDPAALLDLWERAAPDVGFLPTPIAELAFSRRQSPGRLRTMLVGGDRLRVKPHGLPFKIINNYGPTESTVVATAGEIRQGDTVLHIGGPIANTQVYLLDHNLRLVPHGACGELFIGGVGLARGYWNRPDLTSEKFIADPFGAEFGARLYATGDLCRWLPDGTLEYLGRNDEQVKIRGFRIELREIESCLSQHTGVAEVVAQVLEEESGEKKIVTYIVLRRGEQFEPAPNIEALYDHAKAFLPEYMIPVAFVILERFPLTANGKLDRRALPKPTHRDFRKREYLAPRNDAERLLAEIWCSLLSVDRIGYRDHFFELGGHSLLALKLVFRIQEVMGSKLTVSHVYQYPTLEELAKRISGQAEEERFVNLEAESFLDDDIRRKSGILPTAAGAILITGCTGFVGRFLLSRLCSETSSAIYCLVRARTQLDASARIREALSYWGLWSEELERRIYVIRGDLRLPKLGLDDELYDRLCRETRCIYHCATSMNHLETYSMAKAANVEGVRELLKIATTTRVKVVNYVSTLSVFSPYSNESERVIHEGTAIAIERHPETQGYAASKWVGEQLILKACQRGIPCNIFRLGVIWADSILGRYDTLQREYRVLKTSLLCGVGVRDYGYQMAPAPVDYVASAIVALATRHPEGQGVFHIALPEVKVVGLFEKINESLETPLELVSEFEWIANVKNLHYQGTSLPAVPLIEFAFELDESWFDQHRRRASGTHIRFECDKTKRELTQLGVEPPKWDDKLLELCIRDMCSRDEELRAWVLGSETRLRRHCA